jgi:serine/threonine-protein kinase PknK
MAKSDPLPTQGDVHAGILAELVAAGFADPEEIGRGGFGGWCIAAPSARWIASSR